MLDLTLKSSETINDRVRLLTFCKGSKYDRIMDAVDLLERRPDAADWVRRLRDAALLDENGTALDGAIKTIGTFAEIRTDD